MVGEEVFDGAKAIRKQAPQPFAADFGARAGKAFDRTLWVFAARFANRRRDAHPGANGANFAKGHAGLHHAERSGVHAEKDHPFVAVGKLLQVRLVRGPRVIERIIDVCDRGREFDAVNDSAEFARGFYHLVR